MALNIYLERRKAEKSIISIYIFLKIQSILISRKSSKLNLRNA